MTDKAKAMFEERVAGSDLLVSSAALATRGLVVPKFNSALQGTVASANRCSATSAYFRIRGCFGHSDVFSPGS